MRYIFSDESKVLRRLFLVNRYRLEFEKTLFEVSHPVFRLSDVNLITYSVYEIYVAIRSFHFNSAILSIE